MNATNTLVETANETQVVNLALNGKLLDNGRILMASVPSSGSSTLSLPIMLVLIFIVASIVGVIMTALFVMRSRFSNWRLNTAKEVSADPEQGLKTDEKEAATTVDTSESAEEKPSQASPASNAPLIAEESAKEETLKEVVKEEVKEEAKAEVNEEVKEEAKEETNEVTKEEEAGEVKPSVEVGKDVPAGVPVTSSSSLIVSVLNELSESVACKLEGDADPEKEPLKTE